MQKKGVNVSLTSYDDIFSTEQDRTAPVTEEIRSVPLSQLHPFKDHPFKVMDDDAMSETVESVKQIGVVVPLIARPTEDGYEIVSGHRRHHAAELAGLETVPVIVREMDDDSAVIFMVDSNLQRENILPSEKALAYKMKLEALKHQGERRDLTSDQVGRKLEAADIVGEDVGESKSQVRRYIRLTNLIPEVLDMVDQKQIAFNPAVELSYLKPEEQQDFLEAIDMTQTAPSLSQAQRIKKLSQEGACTADAICDVMSEAKKPEVGRLTFSTDSLRKYFPKSYTAKQMEETIIRLLEQYMKKRQRDMER
jgi:ParB family chromosome partitioning protein